MGINIENDVRNGYHSCTINMKLKLLKALYKFRKEMGDYFGDDVQLTIKIFDTVITPILCSVLEIDIIF